LNWKGRTGIFGGTFNPPHNAHLLVARTALRQAELSRILFVPSGIPPHKEIDDGVSKEDRFAMVSRGVAPYSRLAVSRIEIDREGPSYTIETIRALRDVHPEGICFIVGADLLAQIETWREPDALLASVPFLIAPRNGVPPARFEQPPFEKATLRFLDMDPVDLSSTQVRERVRRGEPIEEDVPRAVVEYIQAHHLYRDRQPVRVH
jgi:nicotinate-nucleotide adenylyltransferase